MSAISTITTLGLGALHALEPGHGKAFLASYVLGNELDRKKTLKIIMSMAISHSLLLLIIAIIVPLFFPNIEEKIHFFIMITASIFILFVGCRMLINCLSKKQKNEKCSCGQDHSILSHNQIHANFNSFPSHNTTKINVQNLNFNSPTPLKKTEKDNSIMVGIVNGIMPCPSALAVVGIAFTQSSTLLISMTMLSYVIGFVGAMIILLGLVLFFKKKMLSKTKTSSKTENYIYIISSVLIILSGFYYLYLSLNHSH
jgi:ABC-type nickel/cobalt efflux system permease component RcnA